MACERDFREVGRGKEPQKGRQALEVDGGGGEVDLDGDVLEATRNPPEIHQKSGQIRGKSGDSILIF